MFIRLNISYTVESHMGTLLMLLDFYQGWEVDIALCRIWETGSAKHKFPPKQGALFIFSPFMKLRKFESAN